MRKLLILGIFSLLFLTPAATNAQTADGVIWRVEYFDNFYLFGPANSEGEWGGPIDINWGLDGPGGGIQSDGWTARFVGDAYFPAGTYRFTMRVDDGAQLRVSNLVLIDNLNFDEHAPGEDLTAEITLDEGMHQIVVTYIENEFQAFLYLDWAPASAAPQPSTTEAETSTVAAPASGEPQAVINVGRLNVRAAPEDDADILGVALRGEAIPLNGRLSSGDWWEVIYNQQVGYVSACCVIPQNADRLVTVDE